MSDQHTSDKNITIPRGFTLIEGRGTQPILVPTYLVLATKTALEVENKKEELNLDESVPTVCIIHLELKISNMSQPRPTEDSPYQGLAGGLVRIPADPVSRRGYKDIIY